MKPNDLTDIAVYADRRRRLAAAIGEGVAVIATAPERARNRDTHYPYRHDSYFYYLTGFPEPEAVLVLAGGAAPRSILFCREKNAEREIWDGFRHGPQGASERFGFDEATRSPRSTSRCRRCSPTARRCGRRSAPTPNGTRA
jgi:Xaa-Pro aminopeptidase